MPNRGSLGTVVFIAAMCITPSGAHALDESKAASPYPDLRGKWERAGGNGEAGRFDPTYEANLADKNAGGQGSDPTYKCLPPGMPRIMHAYSPMEVVVTIGAQMGLDLNVVSQSIATVTGHT
jgi:hypothetical protein